MVKDLGRASWGRAKAAAKGYHPGLRVPSEGLKKSHNSTHILKVYSNPAAASQSLLRGACSSCRGDGEHTAKLAKGVLLREDRWPKDTSSKRWIAGGAAPLDQLMATAAKGNGEVTV